MIHDENYLTFFFDKSDLLEGPLALVHGAKETSRTPGLPHRGDERTSKYWKHCHGIFFSCKVTQKKQKPCHQQIASNHVMNRPLIIAKIARAVKGTTLVMSPYIFSSGWSVNSCNIDFVLSPACQLLSCQPLSCQPLSCQLLSNQLLPCQPLSC